MAAVYSNRGDTSSRDSYQKLAPMHVTKMCGLIRRLCLKVSGTRKLHGIEAAFYSMQASGSSILSVYHPNKDAATQVVAYQRTCCAVD